MPEAAIAAAVDMIVHVERMSDGVRRITRITEVTDLEKETIVTQDIFEFETTGVENRRVVGHLVPLGIRPKCAQRLEMLGVRLPPRLFSTEAHSLTDGRAHRLPARS